MIKKRGSKSKINNVFVTSVVIALLVGSLIGFYSYIPFSKTVGLSQEEIKETKNNYDHGEYTAIIKVPAVDKEGKGIATDLIVSVKPGTGKTLVDINSLLFWVDTQNSIRMAKLVANNVTRLNIDSYDITYSINADAALIGGESAGAALTIATIAALENLDIREDVLITGTINHDGSIGPVGGILEKAKAAKSVGSTTFLVPLLQSGEIVYEENEHCEKFGLMEWCTIERVPKEVDISSEARINVVEVGNIRDAMEYFTS